MKTDSLTLIKTISGKTLAPMVYSSLDDEELVELCNLQVAVFFENMMSSDISEFEPLLDIRLQEMCDEVTRRAPRRTDIEKAVMFSRALHELSRTGRPNLKEFVRTLDRRIVDCVLETGTSDWRLHHAALAVLMGEPLTGLRFEGMGERSRIFSVGQEYFENMLRCWADTIDINGSWKGICPAEALSRIVLFTRDFGSVEGVDNRDIMERAYNRYSSYICRNAQELEIKFRACTWQWTKSYGESDMERFIMRAEELLQDCGLAGADRWRLHSVMLRAADILLSIEEQSAA